MSRRPPVCSTRNPAGHVGTVPLTGPIRMTKWTASKPVTKHLRLAADGSVEKVSTAAMLYEGAITRMECSPAQFVRALDGIGPNDCLSYGVPIDDAASEVMSKSRFDASGKPSQAMTRTTDAMTWPKSAGIMMIDHDEGDKTYTPDELRALLYDLCPALRDAAHISAASTSSCLTDTRTKTEIRGIVGQRVYIVVADATDITRAADVLFKRAWLAGLGAIKISHAGSMLVRTILDRAVFQPTRIDYCAPAICDAPLSQRKPKPKLHGDAGLALDTRQALPDLPADQIARYELVLAAAKASKAGDAAAARTAYVEDRVSKLVASGVERAVAEKTITSALDTQILGAGFVLVAEDGRLVTVGQMLADRATWHGKNFADPIELDYNGDARIARAYLSGSGRPRIHSFAHGGQTYLLSAAPRTIVLVASGRHSYMEEIVEEFLSRGEFYQRARELVSISSDCRIVPQGEQSVLAAMDRSFCFKRSRKNELVLADAPSTLAKMMSEAYAARFPVLNAVVTAPIIDPRTGRLISTSGYDAVAGVYAQTPDHVPSVSAAPTPCELELALLTLWWPIRRFPFEAEVDESVMLAAMLTAVLRPLLPTAPAFAFDAPVQASGKTLLIKCLAALGGSEPAMSPTPNVRNDEEMRKRLFATLRGGNGTIVFDNIVGEFDSPSLASMLTSEMYSDRILGKSEQASVATRALVLLSGNNFTPKGDLPRRILRCRIDPGVDSPHRRQFDFDPLEVIKMRRQEIVAAALTILTAYKARGSSTNVALGRLGSFEVWDDWVRQSICWLAQLQAQGVLARGVQPNGNVFPRLIDAIKAIDFAVENDPATAQHGRLLSAWASRIGTGRGREQRVTVKELVARSTGIASGAPATPDPNAPDLFEVLKEIAGERDGINNAKQGRALTKFKDRIVDGLVLRQGAPYQGAQSWWVEDRREPGDVCEVGEVISFPHGKNSPSLSPKGGPNKLTVVTNVTERAVQTEAGRS